MLLVMPHRSPKQANVLQPSEVMCYFNIKYTVELWRVFKLDVNSRSPRMKLPTDLYVVTKCIECRFNKNIFINKPDVNCEESNACDVLVLTGRL